MPGASPPLVNTPIFLIMTTSELRKQKIILLPEALPHQECTTLMTIVYQTPQAELIQVRPNGGNLYKKCRADPHFYIEFTDYNLTLKKALLRRWHHRTGILMDNDIGSRETAQNRLLHLVCNHVGLHQREVIFHFQMNLNKAGRP